MPTPRVEIDLSKVVHNANALKKLYGDRGIRISAVTKVVCGDPRIAAALVDGGITELADSRIANIRKMRGAGVDATFLLVRIPSFSEAAEVVTSADRSLNSDLTVIRELSWQAVKQGVVHGVVLMVELGDLREGLMPAELLRTVAQVRKLDGVALAGIGTNLACFGGIQPDAQNMDRLSELARDVEREFGITLAHVSGGNSANYTWFMASTDLGMVNELRLGESIYLGRETLFRAPIPGLFTDAFTLVAEVIESRTKPSVPHGQRCQNAAGVVPQFVDQGDMGRVILALGSQDVLVSGLTPKDRVEILGGSGDHTILDVGETTYISGDEVAFGLDYGALLTAMTSPYVEKVIV